MEQDLVNFAVMIGLPVIITSIYSWIEESLRK